jgi:hypothetical protein
MAWTDFFRSRYVRSLESELASIRQKHTEETERIKTVHAQELERAINEANRGWAEADRLRQYLFPGLAPSTRVPETADTPNKEPIESGTPFQRMARRIMEEDQKQYGIREVERKAKEEAAKVSEPAQAAPKEN